MLPVYDILTGWPPLAAMLQRGDEFAIYPELASEDSPLPFIIYAQTGKQPIQPLAGIPDADFDNVGIDCWAAERDTAMTLAETARDAFDHARDGVRPWGYMQAGFSETFDASARAWCVSFSWGLWTLRNIA